MKMLFNHCSRLVILCGRTYIHSQRNTQWSYYRSMTYIHNANASTLGIHSNKRKTTCAAGSLIPKLTIKVTVTDALNTKLNFSSFSCWKCQTTVSLTSLPTNSPLPFPLKCPKCDCLQPQPKDVLLPNYFEILGFKKNTYKINLPKVSSQVKRLQLQLHPDLFTQKEKIERELSENLSSLVNKANHTLQDPIERGQYLLKLKGIEIDFENEKVMDTRFLGEMMELNERLEKITTAQEWKDFRTVNQQTLISLEMELESAFDDKNDLEEAQLLLNKMKFYESLQLRLKSLQFKFGVVD